MSICTPNHPFTADIHIVAQILVFNIKLFPKMNSFSFQYARIVLAPDKLSPKQLKTGDLVVDYSLTVSLTAATVLLHNQIETSKIKGSIKAIQGRATTATTIQYSKL